jgi:hypothetical protein
LGQFDEAFTLFNRAQLALVPRGSHFVWRYERLRRLTRERTDARSVNSAGLL